MTMLRSSARSSRAVQYDSEEGMRFLRPDEQENVGNGRNGKFSGHLNSSFTVVPFSWKHMAAFLLIIFVLKLAVRFESYRLPSIPDPASFGVDSDSIYKTVLDTDHFVTSRAKMYLHKLTSFGVRMAGTIASDETSVHWLLSEIDDMHKQLSDNSPHKLRVVADHVSGDFFLPFPAGYTSVYVNVTNVLARLDPISGNTEDALLLNCHFDSYFETVGASDDAVSCAIMLEVLRAILSSPKPLRHSVIFLFNGAEENILQASNGFVAGSSKVSGNVEGAGHSWAKNVRAFINMEAAGAGGRELMFQTGPGPAAPILVKAYAESVPYPYASVLAQEVFQSGLIPSDTDFRIFRDYGHIPGVDLAFYVNGFVYHTEYDTADKIPDGTLEHAGANVLAMTRKLASIDLSTMPPVKSASDHSGESLVFFDIFSSFMVIYPFSTIGLLFNFAAVGGTIWRIYSLITKCRQREGASYRSMLISGIFAHLQALIAAIVALLAIAFFLSSTSSCMCWYSRPWLLIPIYMLPAVCASFAVHSLYFKCSMIKRCSSSNFAQNCERIYDISYDSALTICSVGIVFLSFLGIASSYVLSVWVGFPLLCSAFMDRWLPVGKPSFQRSNGFSLLLRHCALTLIPTYYFLYISDALYELFVPIMGRSGGHLNPEIFIAVVCFFTLSILLLFHGPLIYLTGGQVGNLILTVGWFSGFILITVLLTPFGNPYSFNGERVDGVHVQRSVAQLTMQRKVDNVGKTESADTTSGIWLIPLDFNGIAPLKGYSGRLNSYLDKAELACQPDGEFTNQPYCGLPYFFPVTQFVGGKTWWIGVEASQETVDESYWPTIKQMPTSPRLVSAGRWLLQYRVDCGDTPQCSLYISPHSHTAMLKWHFSNQHHSISNFPDDKLVAPPEPTDTEPRNTWFVMLRFGSSRAETRLNQRSIIVTLEMGASGLAAASGVDLLDFAIVSHYFRGSSENELREMPVELRSFTSALPPWHFTIPVTSLYTTYAF